MESLSTSKTEAHQVYHILFAMFSNSDVRMLVYTFDNYNMYSYNLSEE